MKTLKVDVVNAEKTVFSGDAKFVALPGVEGELGVLPGHVPFITQIKPGFVRVTLPESDEVRRIFVAGEDLDEAKAKKALEDAKAKRQNATGSLEIARLEAEMLALTAELAEIKKLSGKR